MKKLVIALLVLLVVVGVFVFRPNKSVLGPYDVLPSDMLLVYNVIGLNNELDFWEGLDLFDGDILSELTSDMREGQLAVKLLVEHICGDNFVIGYKDGGVCERLEEGDLTTSDLSAGLILAAKPSKGITLSVINSALAKNFAEISVSSYRDVSVNTVVVAEEEGNTLSFSYCVVDGIVLAGFSYDTVCECIDIARRGSGGFSDTDNYKKLKTGISGTDFMVAGADIGSLMKIYLLGIEAVLSESDNVPGSMKRFDSMKSQLDKLQVLYSEFGYAIMYAGRTDNELYIKTAMELTQDELHNLYGVIYQDSDVAAELFKYNIESPLFASGTSLNIKKYMQWMLEYAGADERENMLKSFEDATGVGYDEFSDCFGNGWTFAVDEFSKSVMIPNVGIRFIAGLNEEHDILNGIVNNSISEMQGMQQQIDGVDVYYIQIPFTTYNPAVSVKGDRLFFSSSLDIMHQLIQGEASGKSLADNKGFMDFIGGDKCSGWSYMDMHKVLDLLADFYSMYGPRYQKITADETPEDAMENAREFTQLIEKLKMFIVMYSKEYREGDNSVGEMIIKYDANYLTDALKKIDNSVE